MDRHAQILKSISGLGERLDKAGVQQWLDGLPTVKLDGNTFFVLARDRLASRAEAMLTFAMQHELVSSAEVQSAEAAQPLPPDVEGVEIDTPDGGK